MARRTTAALRALLVGLLCMAMMLSSSVALAAGTGDDPTPTEDVLTPKEAARKAHFEHLSDTVETKTQGRDRDDDVSARYLPAPYYYVWTPSHKQDNSYYCGPATVQVIDDYWGSYYSQSTYANYMGTTTSGTNFSLVDNAIRAYTGISNYYYYGGLTESGFSGKVEHALYVHHYPMATDVKIYAWKWPNYNYNHAGHIIPIDGFSWTYDSIRVNDVFNEADYYSGGGSTYGHKTYSFDVIWHGVYNHFRRSVVCPG